MQCRDRIAKMTAEQRHIFDLVMDHVRRGAPLQIFIDARGGTGKTFVVNSILKRVQSQGKTAIATTTSGITATLLEKGVTLHSAFVIPIDFYLQSQPTCK